MPTIADSVATTSEDYYVSSTKEKEKQKAATADPERVSQEAFLKLLVAQLTHQDPLDPMKDTEFMSQVAQLQALDEQINMTKTITGMRLDAQLRAGSELIGRQVSGDTDAGSAAAGEVTSVSVRSDKTYLQLDTGFQLPYENVTGVTEH